jgi:hypothetical protein
MRKRMKSKSILCAAWLLAVAASGPARAQLPLLTMRVPDETAPPGGFVQMKVRVTEVTPISGGRPMFAFDESVFSGVAGFGVFAPTGEVAGAAVINGNHVEISYVRTTAFVGEYPVLTVVLPIRSDAIPGSSALFTLDPATVWNLAGADTTIPIRPGKMTVGESVAIADVIPGEGVFPGGTVVSVRGVGFNSRTRLRVKSTDIANVSVVSSSEIQFTLVEPTDMTGKEIQVDNPDNSRDIYFSYMRGIPAAVSARTLLATTEPIFSGATRSIATFGPLPPMTNGGQYTALALQNTNLTPVDVTVALDAPDGTRLHASSLSLSGGHRLALELSEFLDGVVPPAGASITVTSSLPIEAFRMLCDESTWTVTPFLANGAAL